MRIPGAKTILLLAAGEALVLLAALAAVWSLAGRRGYRPPAACRPALRRVLLAGARARPCPRQGGRAILRPAGLDAANAAELARARGRELFRALGGAD